MGICIDSCAEMTEYRMNICVQFEGDARSGRARGRERLNQTLGKLFWEARLSTSPQTLNLTKLLL
jgi:hypothetical protein